MRVMVKEARKFSSNFQYPERAKKDKEGSAHIRLSKELFGKYKGEPSSWILSCHFSSSLNY